MSAPYYQDDLVTLYHGDCRDVREWFDADVLVTDPPYGIRYRSAKNGPGQRLASQPPAAIAGDESLAVRDAVLDTWGDRPALVFGNWKTPPPAGTRTVLVWDKGSHVGMGDLRIPWKPNHEQVYVLGKGFSGKRSTGILTGHWVVTWASRGRSHPNEKPVSLLAELLAKCPSGVVADPFAGSGSTLIAAAQLGRRAVGVEIDEAYCEVIARRLGELGPAGGQPLVGDLDHVAQLDTAVDGGDEVCVGLHDPSMACAHHATQGVTV